MCGVAGFVSLTKGFSREEADNKRNFAKKAMILSAFRGEHSTGIFYEQDKKTEIYKKAMSAYDFVQLPKVNEVLKQITSTRFLGIHARYATMGAMSALNAHPFEHGHVTLMHNGTVTNKHALAKKTFDTDSETIAYALSLEKDPIKILEEIQGAFVLVWNNKEEDAMYIAKNDERPLALAVDNNKQNLYFMSEAWALRGILQSRQVNNFELKPMQMMKIPLQSANLKDATVTKFKKKEKPVFFSNNAWKGSSTVYQKEDIMATDLKFIPYVLNPAHAEDKKIYGRVEGVTWHSFEKAKVEIGSINKEEWEKLKIKETDVVAMTTDRIVTDSAKEKTYVIKKETAAISIMGDRMYVNCLEKQKQEKKEHPGPHYHHSRNPTLLTETEWKDLVKDGCCKCYAEIKPDDSWVTDWEFDKTTNTHKPVCSACNDPLGVITY